jgi:anthranilate synthase component I
MLLKKFPDKKEYSRLAKEHNVIPICAEVLADTETPVSLLKKFYKNRGPLFLFESVEGGEMWGRYSFLGTSACASIGVFKERVEIKNARGCEAVPHKGDPLGIIKGLMDRYKPAEIPGLPRFWGGLVGYLTYEMVSFFENIPNSWPPDKPLAHFIIPDELLIFDNIRHTILVLVITFPTTADNADQLFGSANAQVGAVLKRINEPVQEETTCEKQPGATLHTPLAPDHFRNLVTRIKHHILEGDVIQTVISQPFTCKAPSDILSLYRAQRYINPSPYLFFMHLENMVLVGSSPETMVRVENNVATLRPIAGTRPRGKTEQDDRALANELLGDEKERAEHLMLVDLGRNDLGRVATTGTVQVTDLMVVERYSHVMHLVSNIKCDLKQNVDAFDLLKATFPAGTLSGAPKVRAMQIISELETTPRGPYGGAVGYISFNGNMDMAITIRTACIENEILTVQAGAGIVADSDPENERKETLNKAMAIQKALELIKT